MKMDFYKYRIGFHWNYFIFIILVCSVAGNIPRIDRARALAKNNQLATKIQTSGPSLVNIFKLLEPDRKTSVPKQRTPIPLKPNIMKPLLSLPKNANLKVPVNTQKLQKTARILQNRGLPIAKNRLKMPLPMRPVPNGVKKQLPVKQVNLANKMSLPRRPIPPGVKKQLPVKKVNLPIKSPRPYYSPKRQRLWFPGQNNADAASLKHIQEGLEQEYQVEKQQSLLSEKGVMPIYPATNKDPFANLITNKKLNGYYETALDRIQGGRPKAVPPSIQKPAATKVTGYANKNIMPINADNVMAGPYVDLNLRPLSETAAYFRHLQPPVAINAMPKGIVARQSASFKPESVHMPMNKAVSKIDKTARRTIDKKYANGVVSRNSEGTRANANGDVLKAVGPVISRWDKIQKGQEERWRGYQKNKDERWKNFVAASDTPGNIESRMTNAKGPSIPQELESAKRFNGRHNAAYDNSPSNLRYQSQEQHSQSHFARRTKPSQDSYDYKAKAKTNENFNFDSNTQELLPGGDPAAVSLCDSPCDSGKNVKVGNQNNVVSLEVVDNPELHRDEPSKGVIKPKIPTGGSKNTPFGKPDKNAEKQGKPLSEQKKPGKEDLEKPNKEPEPKPHKPTEKPRKPDKPVGELGKPDKPTGEFGKPDKPVGELGKPDKPTGELGKPDKPVGELGKTDKPTGELGKPDKPVGELGKPDKPMGEFGKPDKPVGELGKPDKPVGEPGESNQPNGEPSKPDKPVGELGKPDKPIGQPGESDRPTGEPGKPDKPVGEPGKSDKPVGEIGKPDKPAWEPWEPEKPAGELGKPDKPVGEPGKPDKPVGEPEKPVGEIGNPDKPVGEPGQSDRPTEEQGKPDKPVGEIGKPDKPVGEPGEPEKPVGEIGKPDKPIGEPGEPEKPVGGIGKPDKPVGEPGEPEKPVGEIGKPDKPIGEPGEPEKPVGGIGKPDKPIGEPGEPEKPVGEIGRPDKPVGEPGEPEKPVGEIGKPDKPVGEPGQSDRPTGEPGKPDIPVGEIGKPDKPVGEPGEPEKPTGEPGKPDKPVGEIGKPDKPVGWPEKPVGELGKPEKPIGEPGEPEKPAGEQGKPDKQVGEIGKPDKLVGEIGKPDKPVGEIGKPDKLVGGPEKPVGELGKPDKPTGEPGEPEKPTGGSVKPDKPFGEIGKPDKPVGELGKPDKPTGEPGEPERPTGGSVKPDKPFGEIGKPDKPVGELGKPDKPVGEPEKPVGELGKPEKPIGGLGEPNKPIGELGKPDKPFGEPEKPVGEISKPDKPVGEIGKPDKPVGEPEKPVGELGKPEKPIGGLGEPNKPIGELGKPDKPVGEPEKPVGEIGKPDKPVGEIGKPNKCKPKKPIRPVEENGHPGQEPSEDDACPVGKPLKQGCPGSNPCPEFIPNLYENGAGPTLSVPQKPGVDRPPETPSRLLEEALLNQMEQRLASVLSLMQYVGGLHTIEISSSGCDDPPANEENCDKATASIIVDGEQVSDDNIGFNIAVLDYPSFAVKTVKSFNTNMDVAKSQQMAAFLMSLNKKNLLLVAVKGDVVGAVSQEVWDALTLFGARPPFEKRRRSSFAFIGCRSGCQVPWIQQVQRPPSQGPSNIQLIIGSRNKEYISFGGSGQTVDDVIKAGTKPSSTMSEGYNAGLPAQFFARPSYLEDQSRSSSSESGSERLQDIADLRKAGRHGLEKEALSLSPYGRGLQRESRDQDKNIELERAGYRISPGEKFGSQRPENAKEDHGNEQKNINQDASAIPIEAEADNEPFSEDAVSFKPQAPETVADLKLQEHNAELKQESSEKHRKDGNFENKQRENADVGNLELLKEKYSEHMAKESKQSAQFRQPETDSRYNNHAKAARFDGLESADNVNPATRKNKNDREPVSAVSSEDRARYVGPLRADKMTPQAERTNFKYQGGNARVTNEDRLSAQPVGHFIERRPKEHAEFASNTDGHRFKDWHGYGASSKPISGHGESYYGEQALESHRGDSKSVDAIGKQSVAFQGNRNQERVNKGENLPIERADRLTFIKAGSADRQEAFKASSAMGKHDSKYERLQPVGPDETLCKHCDVKPEVSFKLEESAVGQNPKIKCQGCNKDFEPAVDSMKFDMAVASDKISPNSWQTMKDEPSKTGPSGAANKIVANTQRMREEYRASMRQAEGEKVDPNVCKHCDVKPEVSFKLQGSALESDPKKYQCKGCNKDFKPAVDNIKFDMSMAGDKISPNSWKTMKDQSNVKPFRGIPKEMPLGVEAEDRVHNKDAGKRVGFSSSGDGRRQQKDAESSGSVNKQPERHEQAGTVNSYTHGNEAADQREPAGTASNGFYGNNNDKLAKPDKSAGHSVQSYEESALQKQGTARQNGNEKAYTGQQRQGYTSSDNERNNSPSDKARGNGEQSASGSERPTNDPSLVDVVNKGIMALRESSFDIKLGENNNVNIHRDSKDASQQQPEEHEHREEQHQQLHEGRNQHEQNEPSQQRPEQQHFEKQSPPNLMNELREPNQPETDNHGDTNNAHENKKIAWHEKDCDPNTENCEKLANFMKNEKNSGEFKISSQDVGSLSKLHHNENSPSQDAECKRFFALPERSKRKLHKKEIARYKKNCLPKTPQETDALRLLAMNLLDKGTNQKISPQDPHSESSIIASAAAVKATNSGFHPGYTTIAEFGDVSSEKKVEEMPDSTETFISRAVRPDFSTLPGENPSKTSDMSFYFNHKNNQNEKSLLYRANPIGKEDRIITDGSNNIYDSGDILGAAESLLQKDYSMAFDEATSALNQRVDDEQRQLNNERTSLLSKRMLKKPKLSKQQPPRSSKPNTAVRRLQKG